MDASEMRKIAKAVPQKQAIPQPNKFQQKVEKKVATLLTKLEEQIRKIAQKGNYSYRKTFHKVTPETMTVLTEVRDKLIISNFDASIVICHKEEKHTESGVGNYTIPYQDWLLEISWYN